MLIRLSFALALAGALTPVHSAAAATFHFIRHAESTANTGEAATLEEAVNPPLTALGTQQAQALVGRLADVDLTTIYVSSYQRTSLTIEPTASVFGLTPIVVPAIREWEFGDVPLAALGQAIPSLYGGWLAGNLDARIDAPESGAPSESLSELIARVVPAYQSIIETHRDDEGDIAIVGHGGSIAWVMPFLADNVTLPFALSNNLKNTGIVTLEVNGDARSVTSWDGTPFDRSGPVLAAVPLPAGGGLLLVGVGTLGALRARRRKSARSASI